MVDQTEEEKLAAEEKAEFEARNNSVAKNAEPSKPAKEPKAKKEKPAGELVMYCPGEGDPVKTKWRGVEFLANKPVMIYDPDHVDAARGNKQFSVGNQSPDEDAVLPPEDAMEYRGHVISWLKNVETIDQFVEQWAKDRTLRVSCEVAQDDLNYLGTLIGPKLTAMRKAEGKSENDVAAAFINRGELVIPWRS